MHTKPDLIARLMPNVPYVLQWMIVAVVSQISCLWSRCQRPSLNPAPAAVWATCHSTGLPSLTAHHAYHKQQYWTLNHIVHVLTLSKCVFSIPVNHLPLSTICPSRSTRITSAPITVDNLQCANQWWCYTIRNFVIWFHDLFYHYSNWWMMIWVKTSFNWFNDVFTCVPPQWWFCWRRL